MGSRGRLSGGGCGRRGRRCPSKGVVKVSVLPGVDFADGAPWEGCFVGDGVSLEFVGWELVFWEWQLLFLGFLFEGKTGWAASIPTGTGTSNIVRIKSIDGLDNVVPRNTLAAFASAGLSDGGLRHGLVSCCQTWC